MLFTILISPDLFRSFDWKLILEYIKVLVWPFLLLYLVHRFKFEILAWLSNRNVNAELPGGVKLNFPLAQDKKQMESKPKTQEIEEQYKTKIKEQSDNIEKTKKDLTYTQIYLDFERIYRIIFGSQINLLKRLRTLSSLNGEAKKDTIFFFVLTQRLFPIFADWTFDMYMTFLLSNGLVLCSNNIYSITDKGKAFLAYIEYLNFPQKNL